MKEDQMVGWNHSINGHEFKQTLGDNEGQKSLECCSSWGCRVRHDLANEQQQQSLLCILMCPQTDLVDVCLLIMPPFTSNDEITWSCLS